MVKTFFTVRFKKIFNSLFSATLDETLSLKLWKPILTVIQGEHDGCYRREIGTHGGLVVRANENK